MNRLKRVKPIGLRPIATAKARGIYGLFSNLNRFAQVAPSIMPIKVRDSDGWGTEFGLVDGIHYAAVHAANVINLSLRMAAPSAVVAQAIDDAVLHGVVYRCSYRQRGVHFPVSAPHTLAVATTDTTDTNAPCSTYGAFVDVSVPGVAIDNTYAADGDAWPCSRP